MRKIRTLELVIRPKEAMKHKLFGMTLDISKDEKYWYLDIGVGDPQKLWCHTVLDKILTHFVFVKTESEFTIYRDGEVHHSMILRDNSVLNPAINNYISSPLINPNYLKLVGYDYAFPIENILLLYDKFKEIKLYEPVIIKNPCSITMKMGDINVGKVPVLNIQASTDAKNWSDITDIKATNMTDRYLAVIQAAETKSARLAAIRKSLEDVAWYSWKHSRRNKKNFDEDNERFKFNKWFNEVTITAKES